MQKKMKEQPQKRRREAEEFQQEIVDLARVTRVMAGGKRLRFRACVAIGDGSTRVAVGVAKGADVTAAINKAANKAKKQFITVSLINETIPYSITKRFGSAKIMLKPAPKGTGVKAGGAMRTILVLAGVPNVVGKIMGSNNKINNVFATIEALKDLKKIQRKPRSSRNAPVEKNAKKESGSEKK